MECYIEVGGMIFIILLVLSIVVMGIWGSVTQWLTDRKWKKDRRAQMDSEQISRAKDQKIQEFKGALKSWGEFAVCIIGFFTVSLLIMLLFGWLAVDVFGYAGSCAAPALTKQ